MKQKVSIQFHGKLPEPAQAEVDKITEHILETARSDANADRIRETIRGEVAVMYVARMRRYRPIGDITDAQYLRLMRGITSDLRLKYKLIHIRTEEQLARFHQNFERFMARSERKYKKAALPPQ
jgi:hypothetical protein